MPPASAHYVAKSDPPPLVKRSKAQKIIPPASHSYIGTGFLIYVPEQGNVWWLKTQQLTFSFSDRPPVFDRGKAEFSQLGYKPCPLFPRIRRMKILTRSRRIRKASQLVLECIPTKDRHAIEPSIIRVIAVPEWWAGGISESVDPASAKLAPQYDRYSWKLLGGPIWFCLLCCRLYSEMATSPENHRGEIILTHRSLLRLWK